MGRRRGCSRSTSRLRGGPAYADRNHRVRARRAAQQRRGEGDRLGAGKFRRLRAAHGRGLGRGGPMTAVSNLDDFRALDPFFRIIEEGVAGLVDGEHFFDLLAEDVVFEYVITVPDYPRRVEGRGA